MFPDGEHIQADLFGQFDFFEKIQDTLMNRNLLPCRGIRSNLSKRIQTNFHEANVAI